MTTETPGTVAEIEWDSWIPKQRATLLFVVRDGHVLLIHKKRGLGAGKINGPGGRLDDGESPAACAIREVEEELLVTPTGIRQVGELRFQFVDGLSIHGYVFRADDCLGEPQETDEAVPLWTPIDRIPYDRMWADDRLWIPLMLQETWFSGRFIFDEDEMVDYQIDTGARTGPKS